jgi:hypothetical protein
MRDWQKLLGLLVTFMAVAAMARGEATAKVDTEKELRALIRDVRGYLRRLDRISPREGAEARREIANGARDLAAERTAMRRAGLPLTRAELKETAPPPEQDAAPFYRQLVRVLEAQPLDPQLTKLVADLDKRFSHTDQQTAALRTLLGDRQDVMGLIHQAGDRPGCSLRADWEHDSTLVSETSAMRQAIRLLRAESGLLARDGHVAEAITNQTRALRIAEHAASDPNLVGYLLTVALYRMALDGMADLPQVAGEDAETAEAVRRAITTNRARLDLRRALVGETVFLVGGMSHMRREVRQTGTDTLRSAYLWDLDEILHPAPRKVRKLAPDELRLWEGILGAVEANLLRQRRRVMVALERPYSERQAALQQIDRTVDFPSRNPVRLLIAYSGLLYSGADRKWAQSRAQEAVLIAGAAVLAFRSRQGRFPETLEQALPESPLDPFNGQPLRYRHTGDGFRVDSVGKENRQSTAPTEAGEPIAFIYPAPLPESRRVPPDARPEQVRPP